jgi:hypothetical protein
MCRWGGLALGQRTGGRWRRGGSGRGRRDSAWTRREEQAGAVDNFLAWRSSRSSTPTPLHLHPPQQTSAANRPQLNLAGRLPIVLPLGADGVLQICGCSLRRDGRFRGGGTKSMGGCGLAREEPPPHGRESTTMPRRGCRRRRGRGDRHCHGWMRGGLAIRSIEVDGDELVGVRHRQPARRMKP